MARSLSLGDAAGTSRTVGTAVTLAFALGILLTAIIFAVPDLILQMYGVSATSELLAASKSYLLTRAVSVPSILLMFVAVGASVGAGNSVAPALGITAAALLNLCGDYVLVVWAGLGLLGAAAATAAASWAGSAIVLSRLATVVSWRPHWPTPSGVAPLLAVSSALLIAQVTNSVTYSVATQTAALAGATNAAAHQIALQCWWLLTYFTVPLYVAAQALLANAQHGRRRALLSLQVLGGLAVAVGGCCVAANAVILRSCTGLFTSDPEVLNLVLSVLPAACAAQAGAALNTTVEGVFLGAGGEIPPSAISAFVWHASCRPEASPAMVLRCLGVKIHRRHEHRLQRCGLRHHVGHCPAWPRSRLVGAPGL